MPVKLQGLFHISHISTQLIWRHIAVNRPMLIGSDGGGGPFIPMELLTQRRRRKSF